MYTKILEKLKTQRGQTSKISDRSLEDLARSMETLVITDEALEKIDFSKAIASLDGNLNAYTAAQIKALEDKKKETPPAATPTTPTGGSEIPEWAKGLMETTKVLSESIAALGQEKIGESRSVKLDNALQGLPDYVTGPIKAAYKNAKFESEESFSEYLTNVSTNVEIFKTAAKEQGLNTGTPIGKPKTSSEENQMSPIFARAFAAVEEADKNKNK